MTIVNYVSTDANDMKISYSSEPVLAMASRYILRHQSTRTEALQALNEFLFQRAIEKGRVVKCLFEHLVLWSIDDSNTDVSRYFFIPAAGGFPPNIQQKITSCQTFLLKCQEKESATVLVNDESQDRQIQNQLLHKWNQYYHVTELDGMISTLLKGQFQEQLQRIISPGTLKSIIGTSHFVQLEVARKECFKNIPNFPGEQSARGNVVDLALLKVGVLRQSGFTMPPNYYGIDFILPMVIDRPSESDSEGLFSFIAVQSKTVSPVLSECTFKMSALFHINRCPHPEHFIESDCIKKDCKAFIKISDIIAIMENQVVIVLTAKSPKPRTLKTTVSLKGEKIPTKTKTEQSKSEENVNVENESIKVSLSGPQSKKRSMSTSPALPSVSDEIIQNAFTKFKDEMAEFVTDGSNEKVEAVSYPSHFDKSSPNCNLK